ncbi:PREDICTED: zinc finger CCHC domain-containing protein 9-like [Cyphomyrmex costatus]|uniref:Zinc finger CCHC domain-containing protein 9 n=1 Tax=Cyphomyrmex costatus TaxID=456900 RepID=A0A195CXI3_9HYME|nr:PREDICTED: zinc finger CCHC domain-containing protein 9-like [Cyphomyrmex costatus]KYN05375.1 Zinc finger CCHC domain-containing protein 9 [Cyphomyrmex costatus]
MTRYARAKGSKASNERLPNEATPWNVMKQQLEENKNKSVEKKKSAKELLKEHEDSFKNDSTNDNTQWAEFEDNRSKSNTEKHKNLKSKKDFPKNSENNIKKSHETGDTKIETTDRKTTNKKKKKQDNNTNSVSNEKDAQKLNTSQDTHSNYVVLSKRQKRNQKRKLEMSNDGSKRFKKDVSDKISNIYTREEKMKKKQEYKRRKPDVGVTKIIINGVETKIVMYDRFPVRKEDAERLTELKQKMILKGIPKSEVDIAMKLERRKAEKALARIRKLVCFNCRKSGHNLSDCPELDRSEACTGICFKCGSTEHTHFECKVNKDSTYRYAKCFICREQGHIAMQCPDNPKGIYPHGGCCKVCGAVTHLKKDCPDLMNAKEDNIITVEKMDNAIESLQEDTKEKCESNKPKNKIIKF